MLPVSGGSVALAELLARSPGARIGGVALKAKSPRIAIAPAVASIAPGADESPRNAFASVLGASAGPEGAVPDTLPIGPGGFPTDFTNPVTPTETVSNTPDVTSPGTSTPVVFNPVTPPPVVGTPIIGPVVPGGPPVVTPTTPPTTTPPVTPPTIPGVPEPATWLMLILGFGAIGTSMRTRLRVRMA